MNDSKRTGEYVVVERTLDVPPSAAWRMWVELEHFKAWYGPQGATIPQATLDAQVGGRRTVCMAMETPNGEMQMWFTGEHTEVVPNERLTYTEAMADAEGNVMSPGDVGMPTGAPESTEVIVQFEDLGDRTKVVMTHVGVPAGSPGEAGWVMAFDKLAAYAGGAPT